MVDLVGRRVGDFGPDVVVVRREGRLAGRSEPGVVPERGDRGSGGRRLVEEGRNEAAQFWRQVLGN